MYYFSKFCRLCIRTNHNLINIQRADEDFVLLSEKMRNLLPDIVYEDDTIPNFICIECCTNLKKLYEFKKMCLKNNEILKLYSSKLLSLKNAPEDRNMENELKLLQEQFSKENSDIDLSIIFVKCITKSDRGYETKTITKVTESATIKEEIITNEERCDIKQDNNSGLWKQNLENIKSEEMNHLENHYVRKSVIENSNIPNVTTELELKLECAEDDDEFLSEDQTEYPGDESMDCDEVISINDTDNENGEEDLIPEPMNLSKTLIDPLSSNSEIGQIVLPPHLASGNRGKTRTNDKYRMVYTEHQRLELEKEYLLNRFVPDRRRAELAISLGLTVRQIKIWFQNRRAKERRETKRTDSSPQDNNPQKILPKLAPKRSVTPDRNRKSSTDTRTSSDNLQSEEFLRKQQEYFYQQQILQQQREIIIQEQILRQRKEFLNQQEHVLQKDFYQQLFQEILRQEEYIRQQKLFFNQHQQLLKQQKQQNFTETSLQQQAAILINQPMLLHNLQVLPTLNNQQLLPQTELFANLAELMKRKEELMKRNKLDVQKQNKDEVINLTNLEELYKRKQELKKGEVSE